MWYRPRCGTFSLRPDLNVMTNDDLYKLLMDEMKLHHQRWVDNYRSLTTVNVVFGGALAAFVALCVKEGMGREGGHLPVGIRGWVITAVVVGSAIGIVANIFAYFIIRRLSILAGFRSKQIVEIETTFGPDVRRPWTQWQDDPISKLYVSGKNAVAYPVITVLYLLWFILMLVASIHLL